MIVINGHKVGEGQSVFIIAEAGVNHNGDLNLARRMIVSAKEAGADCVKFQTFKAESVVTASAPKARYQLEVTDKNESQLQMLKKLELSFEAYKKLFKCCKEVDIEFLSTPYSFEDIRLLEELGVGAYKIASGQLVEPAFLSAVAKTGKPIFLSTGMGTLAEVDEALRTMRSAGNGDIVLLQCTTNYPSRLEDSNLRAIQTMAAAFGTIMGYSDHTQSDTACLVAIGLGARVIEKHLTLDKNMPGPDHTSSANPAEFAILVKEIREAERALGSGRKEPSQIEIINAQGMRRSIVAACKIHKGEAFTEGMLTFKRPGKGIRPALLHELIGSLAVHDIEADEPITWEMCGEKKFKTSL